MSMSCSLCKALNLWLHVGLGVSSRGEHGIALDNCQGLANHHRVPVALFHPHLGDPNIVPGEQGQLQHICTYLVQELLLERLYAGVILLSSSR